MNKLPQFGQPLTGLEKRRAELSALGWPDEMIAARLSATGKRTVESTTIERSITRAIIKLGLTGRNALALWAVDNLDEKKRTEWTVRAEKYREVLLGLRLNARSIRLLQYLSNPATCHLPSTKLGRLLDPPMGEKEVRGVINQCTARIGRFATRRKLAVVLYLAPLVAAEDEPSDGDGVSEEAL